MSYVLSKSMALSGLRSYVVGVLAGLGAAGLTEIAALWQALLDGIAATIATQTAEADAELLTTARVRLCDASWDKSAGELSKKALFLAGGNPRQPPYAPLFGTVKSRELAMLGPAKATLAAGELLARLDKLDEPRLAAEAKELSERTEALAVAEKADASAELKLASHAIERAKLLRKTETLIAETEAKILTLHPGDVELVRAILNPQPPRRSARKVDPAESADSSETPVDPVPATG